MNGGCGNGVPDDVIHKPRIAQAWPREQGEEAGVSALTALFLQPEP